MNKALVAAVLCSLTQAGLAQEGSTGPVVSFSSERFSDPLPLAALLRNDLEQAMPRGGQNLVYLRDEVRAGARWSGGTLSAIARQAVTLVASDGAVRVIQDIATAGGPATSYERSVRLKFSGFAGWGLAFDKAGRTANSAWSWQAGAQILSLRRLLQRDLRGLASYDASSHIYGLHAQSTYANDRLRFPFQQPFSACGWGAFFNGGLSWQANDQARLSLRVQDLGRLQWHGLPQETMQISTSTSQVDADGYLAYRPLVTGLNQQRNHVSQSTATWTVMAQQDFAAHWTAVGSVKRTDGFSHGLPYTGVQWQSGSWQATAGWLWHERALSISAIAGNWRVAVAADRWNASAHARMASVHWQGGW